MRLNIDSIRYELQRSGFITKNNTVSPILWENMTGTEYGHVQTLYYNWLIEWDDKHEHFNDLIATAQKLAKFLGVPIELFTPKTHIGFAKEISKNFAKIPFMIY